MLDIDSLKTDYDPITESHDSRPISVDGVTLSDDKWLFKFDNGYGVSVISMRYQYEDDPAQFLSYGSMTCPYEVCLLEFYEDGSYDLVDDTITGWLDQSQVNEFLHRVEEYSNIKA